MTDGTRYEYTIVGDEDVTLRTMRSENGRRGGVIAPRTDHVVFWLTRGRLEMHFADRTRVIEPGSPYIASASEAYRFVSADTVYNGLHLADPFLRSVGEELGYRLPDGPLLFDQQDATVAQREPLRRLVQDLAPALLDDRVVGPMRTALNRRLAVVVLDTFPIRNRGEDVPVANRLRDAIRYIEAHADDRPSVPEIAEASGLSQRGLQDVFARTLGTTPNRFLRDHRLDCVRRELLRAAGDDGVTPSRDDGGSPTPVGSPPPTGTGSARTRRDPAGLAGCASGVRTDVLARPSGARAHRGARGWRPDRGADRRGRGRASPASAAALPGGVRAVADGRRPCRTGRCVAQHDGRFRRPALKRLGPGYTENRRSGTFPGRPLEPVTVA